MSQRFSRIFVLKLSIFLIFILASLVVSFFLGRQFGYYLMGDLQNESKLQSAVEKADVSEGQYSPLVSPRFKYDPDKYPKEEFQQRASEKPGQGDVVQEGVDVEMNYVPDNPDAQKENKNILNLGEGADQAGPQESQGEENATAANVAYKVFVGTYTKRENAEGIYKKLQDEGYDPYIEAVVKDNETFYRVQIGAFKSVDNANVLAEELRKKGYNAWTIVVKS